MLPLFYYYTSKKFWYKNNLRADCNFSNDENGDSGLTL